jgi:mannose-6-phosphate isomerase-like protein (cupin superfamily)
MKRLWQLPAPTSGTTKHYAKVNGSVVRVGVVKGEYHWHKHDYDDEFFYVIEGALLIDLEERTVDLGPRCGFVIPRGVLHRTHPCPRPHGDADGLPTAKPRYRVDLTSHA